jgi:predicted ATP-dependent protease
MPITSLPANVELTAEQKGQIYGILSVGCDRETAANFIGRSLADIVRAMRQDADFSASVRRTEAAAELNHMRTVQNAAKDEKNWRAAVWWLERRSPERFGSRGAGTVTTRHLKAFLSFIGDCLNTDIHDATDRERVLARLKQHQSIVDDLADEMLVVTTASNEMPNSLCAILGNEPELLNEDSQELCL